jgi:hypothetical protein
MLTLAGWAQLAHDGYRILDQGLPFTLVASGTGRDRAHVSRAYSVCRFEGTVEAANVPEAAVVRDCGDAAVGVPWVE